MQIAHFISNSKYKYLTFGTSFSQSERDNLFNQFQQSITCSVRKPKDSIVNYHHEAIPKLIELPEDINYKKHKNTTDLIYPGAEKFYSHCVIVFKIFTGFVFVVPGYLKKSYFRVFDIEI